MTLINSLRTQSLARFFRKSFFRDVGLLSFAEGISGFVLLLYTIICARQLGVVEYGLFQALLAFYASLSFLALPLYFGSIHFIARAPSEQKKQAASEFLLFSAVLCLCLSIIVAALAVPLAEYLNCKNVLPPVLISLLLFVRSLLMVVYGSLQATLELRSFARARLAESLLCFLSGLLFVFAGLQATGALLGYLVAASSLLIFFVFRMNSFSKSFHFSLLRAEIASMSSLFLGLAVLLALSNFPMLLARGSLDPSSGGYLAALFNLRNLILPFSFAISIAFYTRQLSEEQESAMFQKAILLICVLGLGFLLAGVICPGLIISSIYGAEFAPAATYMKLYGVCLWLEMLSMLMFFHGLASKSFRAKLLIIPVLLTLSMFACLELHSIQTILLIQLAGWSGFIGSQLRFRAFSTHDKRS